jgi:hypothetical protein
MHKLRNVPLRMDFDGRGWILSSSNDVWDIVSRPKENSVVSSWYLYKIKHVAYGSINTFKTCFVARGFS